MISLYESEASGGQEGRDKHFAHEVLPMMALHLKEAEALVHKIGV